MIFKAVDNVLSSANKSAWHIGQLSDPSRLVIISTIPSNRASLKPCNYTDKDSIIVPQLRASRYSSEIIDTKKPLINSLYQEKQVNHSIRLSLNCSGQ
jgi:hypothetical protein